MICPYEVCVLYLFFYERFRTIALLMLCSPSTLQQGDHAQIQELPVCQDPPSSVDFADVRYLYHFQQPQPDDSPHDVLVDKHTRQTGHSTQNQELQAGKDIHVVTSSDADENSQVGTS